MKLENTKEQNDLFFLCSLIEYLGRMTKNHRADIVQALGEKELAHIFALADVYHCENIEKVATELIEKHSIVEGNFDNTKETEDFLIPTHWDIGKVYARLIASLSSSSKEFIPMLIKIYTSWIAPKIDDYRSSMYYENNSYLASSYLAGRVQ